MNKNKIMVFVMKNIVIILLVGFSLHFHTMYLIWIPFVANVYNNGNFKRMSMHLLDFMVVLGVTFYKVNLDSIKCFWINLYIYDIVHLESDTHNCDKSKFSTLVKGNPRIHLFLSPCTIHNTKLYLLAWVLPCRTFY